ncbi:MAG: hypothetical protein KY475_00580 [Planctomycetes bacterium]|nr:hypothetical protein [Planctomycetota bacterium]
MIRHLRSWRKRLAPSLCALLAAGSSAYAADELPAPLAPSKLPAAAAAPIQPAAHTADEEDPAPIPPFNFNSTRASGRRSPAGQSGSPVVIDAAPSMTLSPPEVSTDAVPADEEPLVPIPLPDDVEEGAYSLPPAGGDAPDVNISAPLPAEAPETELVQERYPNGSLKLAREVTQDGQGNFLNHGSWKYWSEQGDLIAEGEYRRGVRHGLWRRVVAAKASPLFATPPYNQYQGPFISEAHLANGKLNGTWVITDMRGHKVSEIEYVNDVRHGIASWWHANGKKMQQITFRNGSAHDEILTWRPDGGLAAKEVYDEGRKIEPRTEHYPNKRKKSSGEVLTAKMVIAKEDDWWNCQLATFKPQGKEERHGAWTSWHPNGQEQVEGRFEYGRPHGEFTWWYANGQKSTEGSYRNGERHGVWTWWHENGLKSSMGDFVDGKPAGEWVWWDANGKVAQKADFADGVPAQALQSTRPAARPGRPSLPQRN